MAGHSPEPSDHTATVPLPAVGPAAPTARVPRLVRALEVVAGLLSAGLLVLGAVLLVLRFAAPGLVSGTGLSAAQGPQVSRIAVQLGVGVLGELLHRFRSRLPLGLRPVVAALVIVVVLVALWWGWWR